MRYVFLIFVTFFLACENRISNIEFNATCDLHIQDCKRNFNGEDIIFSFDPKPFKSMETINIKIYGIKQDYKNLKAHFYGMNMDMGEIVTKLNKSNDSYVGDVAISSCVRLMQYRMELYENDKPLGIFVDFVLKN